MLNLQIAMLKMKNKILIIDDDEELNQLLKAYLEKAGYQVISSLSPVVGIEMALKQKPDLIILDVMMPEMDGFEVCRAIRQQSDVPIIMLTARGEVTDRVVGLELGADDYMPKPFEPRELDARIKTILRRTHNTESTAHFEFGKLILYPEKYVAEFDGELLDISAFEFDLLLIFAKNKGRVLSRDAIMDGLRGVDWSAFDRSIDMLISRLRQKLKDDPKNPCFIKTVRGAGYMFIAE